MLSVNQKAADKAGNRADQEGKDIGHRKIS